MSSKTSTAPARRKGAQQASARGGKAQAPANNAEAAIARAQHGQVKVAPEMAIQMAGKLYSEGKFDQAERVCRQLIAARPGNADAHNILGVSLHALGGHEEAIKSLKRAVELSPEAASIHANLGEILRQQGKI
ncbi:MAG TPA: tetratricopeptide repeat protein, partial [Alphaproteobacteria bacterium]|nr:tetratricopeptide repeat protein [Alphaproteobacteria bacterium]